MMNNTKNEIRKSRVNIKLCCANNVDYEKRSDSKCECDTFHNHAKFFHSDFIVIAADH